MTWHDLRLCAAELLREGTLTSPFDAVIVDEVQDLSVPGLRFLWQLARHRPEDFMVVGDAGGTGLAARTIAAHLFEGGEVSGFRRHPPREVDCIGWRAFHRGQSGGHPNHDDDDARPPGQIRVCRQAPLVVSPVCRFQRLFGECRDA